MNTYYQNNGQINSNNDIFETYFVTGRKPVAKWKKTADYLLSLLAALICTLTGARARTAVRVCGVAFSLVGLVGIIGAMESGALGLAVGAVLAMILIGVEVLCLVRRH